MLALIVGAACLAVLAGALVWFVLPTVETFGGPDFVPVPRDDASVARAVYADIGHQGSAGR